jgi:hypothetical protein
VSVEKDVSDLKLLMRSIEKLVLKGRMPDQPVLYENADGSEDMERFAATYGCTPDEALERGATHIVLRVNFADLVNVTPREVYARPVDPNYISSPPAQPAAEAIPTGEPVTINDPLVDTLVSQARDTAAASDAARAKHAEK